jgi:calcineurin-like phosphoesterase family protein
MDKIVGQKVFFTADLHLGHRNIIGYCNRPFSTGEEMDAKIISSINETVGQNDILYIIGDFCHKGGIALAYRERIICKNVHIILGNHDEPTKFTSGFSSVSDQKMILCINQKYLCVIILCEAGLVATKKAGCFMVMFIADFIVRTLLLVV